MRRILLAFFLFICVLPLQAAEKEAIIGFWYTKDNRSKIQIFRQGEKYYGKITWLKVPLRDGKPKTDIANPDPAKRSQPIIGLVLLRDFVYDDGEWTDGKIYDPDSGKEYSCNMELRDANTLEVRGYVGISLIGRTEVWKRAE